MPRLKSFYVLHPDDWQLEEASLGDSNCPKQLIRQWILRELIESYNYPTDWLGSQINLVDSESFELEVEDFFGICLSTTYGESFFWISIGEENELGKAENLLVSVLASSNSAGFGIVTDGTEQGTKFLRRRFDSDKCEYIVDIEAYSKQESTSSLKLNAVDDIDISNRLLTLSERVENLFFEIHSHIRDIDGFHADEALDELCKILYAISLKIPAYQRSHGVFNTRLRLSSPALVKVVEVLQNYDISHSDTDVKGRAFQKVINPVILLFPK